jgi:hypothetical protein
MKACIVEVVVKLHVFYTATLDGGHLPHWTRLGGSPRSVNVERKSVLPIPDVVVKSVSSYVLPLTFPFKRLTSYCVATYSITSILSADP